MPRFTQALAYEHQFGRHHVSLLPLGSKRDQGLKKRYGSALGNADPLFGVSSLPGAALMHTLTLIPLFRLLLLPSRRPKDNVDPLRYPP